MAIDVCMRFKISSNSIVGAFNRRTNGRGGKEGENPITSISVLECALDRKLFPVNQNLLLGTPRTSLKPTAVSRTFRVVDFQARRGAFYRACSFSSFFAVYIVYVDSLKWFPRICSIPGTYWYIFVKRGYWDDIRKLLRRKKKGQLAMATSTISSATRVCQV